LCENGFYPIHYASYIGDMEIMQILISNGGSIDWVTKQGLTAVHIAAMGGKAYPIAYFYE
jgi:ankyrin repeat protein